MRALLAALGLAAALLAPPAPAVAQDSPDKCLALAGRVEEARSAARVEDYPALWTLAQRPEAGCPERAIHCIGNLLALGQLEAAYRAAGAGAALGELTALAEAGLAYGAPWQLEAGLGDLRLEAGRLGEGGAAYSDAGWHYQQALIALDEPPVCAEYGEPARPDAATIGGLYGTMTTALLLAQPLRVATTRCAPCQWLFLTGSAGYVPEVRPLPITFRDGSAEPTEAGFAAAAALAECLKAQAIPAIVLSGHTDPRGAADYNLRLSAIRLDRVKELLVLDGYAGEVRLEPMGETAPYPVPEGFPLAERLQLDRRIELRQAAAGEAPQCQ